MALFPSSEMAAGYLSCLLMRFIADTIDCWHVRQIIIFAEQSIAKDETVCTVGFLKIYYYLKYQYLISNLKSKRPLFHMRLFY